MIAFNLKLPGVQVNLWCWKILHCVLSCWPQWLPLCKKYKKGSGNPIFFPRSLPLGILRYFYNNNSPNFCRIAILIICFELRLVRLTKCTIYYLFYIYRPAIVSPPSGDAFVVN